MYTAYRDGIEPKCRESFSLPRILAENLLYLTTWSVAGALVWPVRVAGWPVLTLAWALVVVVVQVLLKKHNCSGCYYYGKACHLGWGKLSAWMFRQDSGDMRTGKVAALRAT